ncbi:MAG: hotdog domain-containing protein [Planctomycetota bacterium]|jgi:acyl-CoA hydrolase|nr:hotdog domain-containing protein [Planctomycetota bacterium]
MQNFKLVLPEHLNHYGFLFGGYLLKFVDEVAWIAASLEYPDFNFVTIGMDKVEFRKSVRQGTILRFHSTKTRVGNTSVTFLVEVYRDTRESSEHELVFSTSVTMVRVNETGDKQKINS